MSGHIPDTNKYTVDDDLETYLDLLSCRTTYGKGQWVNEDWKCRVVLCTLIPTDFDTATSVLEGDTELDLQLSALIAQR